MQPVPHDPHRLRIALGRRLRHVRRQQQLSLAEVEARSQGRWKAVSLSAYERGERDVNLPRLAGLATFYGVPLTALLDDLTGSRSNGPDHADAPTDRTPAAGGARRAPRLHLYALDVRDAPADVDTAVLLATTRFASDLRWRRRDHNGVVLTVRRDDLRTVAVSIGREPQQFVAALVASGVVDPTSTTGPDGFPRTPVDGPRR
ncbi:helix-turn-helix domain-containing protein [Egicoccus halophilus]|uniref:Transcriptional regulator n=1 Tax=Egicoccus halophilus TaxID=1670830 RepID=A0A8J3AER4_9ACTN|nr:helix-turn-helix domain-containing protein [Egicoccus halophilus]GGI05915.1 transcriptional regulator [Egicoccus halophilus]